MADLAGEGAGWPDLELPRPDLDDGEDGGCEAATGEGGGDRARRGGADGGGRAGRRAVARAPAMGGEGRRAEEEEGGGGGGSSGPCAGGPATGRGGLRRRRRREREAANGRLPCGGGHACQQGKCPAAREVDFRVSDEGGPDFGEGVFK